jgi:hypothetical protein
MFVVESRELAETAAQWFGRYWRGEMTDNPMPEIFVDGGLYFPGWKSPPFGLFTAMFPKPAPH